MKLESPWIEGESFKARLVWVTPDAEEVIAYVARTSNPKNQENENYEGLLKYCVRNKHFSVFETAFMCLEIVTPLCIATQVLRHKSFNFQQMSLRYAEVKEMDNLDFDSGRFYLPTTFRGQDKSNRQNSILSPGHPYERQMEERFEENTEYCQETYDILIKEGVAKELARMVLPTNTLTRLYMTGSVRSWMHYLDARDAEGVAQLEHVELARGIKEIFAQEFPTVYQSYFVTPDSEPFTLAGRIKAAWRALWA